MSAGARLARLLALVPWLAANDGITLEDAARHFEVSVPELERDLWLLVVCGLPGYGPADLVDIQFWDDGRIHVIDPQTLTRPLRLTPTEATALALGLRLIAQVPGAATQDAIARLTAKLDAAMDAAPAAGVVTVPAGDADVAEAIEIALRDGSALSIRYASATRDEITERVVRPVRVVAVDGRTSLVAECTLAGAVRTFRVDRILAAHPVADPGPVAEPGEAAAPEPLRVTVELAPDAAWFADAHGAASRPAPGGGIVAEVAVHDLSWLARAVLAAGPGARVSAPPEAVEAVGQAARAAVAAYSGS